MLYIFAFVMLERHKSAESNDTIPHKSEDFILTLTNNFFCTVLR